MALSGREYSQKCAPVSMAGVTHKSGDLAHTWKSVDRSWGAANLLRGLASMAAATTLAISLAHC